MQLTMMGALALKSVSLDRGNENTGWSEYAKIVLSIFPLIPITIFVYNILDEAFIKQAQHLPMEIFGKVSEFIKINQQRAVTEAQTPNGEMSTPLEELSAEVISNLGPRHRKPQNRKTSIFDPQTDHIESPYYNSDSPIQGQASDSELCPLLNDCESWKFVETPMTRVNGILDTTLLCSQPLIDSGVAPLDMQASTYMHPALFGPLPVFWIEGTDFEQYRQDQISNQELLLQRYTSRQRLGREVVSAPFTDEGPSFRAVIDGLASWIHLAIS
jgi:hypothetical protein